MKKDTLIGLDTSKPEDLLTFIRISAMGSCEDMYPDAVKAVATILRPRFESGELHGWDEETSKRMEKEPVGGDSKYQPPVWRIGRACSRLFIRTPEVALLVLRCATKSKREPWVWNLAGEGQCLLGEAEDAMAQDVLAFARVAGWSRPTAGEEVSLAAIRRAKTAHGREEDASGAERVA